MNFISDPGKVREQTSFLTKTNYSSLTTKPSELATALSGNYIISKSINSRYIQVIS